MLTEKEISILWRELFRGKAINEEIYVKASELIDALPATSPLRQRYTNELVDLRRIHTPAERVATKSPKRSRAK